MSDLNLSFDNGVKNITMDNTTSDNIVVSSANNTPSTSPKPMITEINNQSPPNLSVSDPLITLSANGDAATSTNDQGLLINRGTLGNVAIIWDESADEFALIDTDDGGDIAGNITIADYFNLRLGALNVEDTVTATGRILTDDATDATSGTDGSLQTDGGLSVAADAVIGDDLKLLSDSAVLSFGADSDTTLTHTDGTGLTLNSTNKLLFRDTGLYINSSTDGQLDLVADTEIQIAATTIDINGAVAMDGAITGATDITLSGELDAATLDISGNADIDGTTNLDAVDIDGAVQIDAAFTSGVDGQGYDTKFFGDTSSAYILWDTSADKLLTAGGAVIDIVKDKLLIGGTAVTTTAAELNKLDGVGTLKEAGKESIWVPANAMTPTDASGCEGIASVATSANKPDMIVLDFLVASDSFAQFQIAFPKSWNEGTITYQVYWCSTATDTDNVRWTLEGVSVPDNSTIDVAYGSAVYVDDPNQGAAEEMLVSPVSGALTIGSAAIDTVTFFRIGRDVSEGTAAEAARLLGVKLFFTTDAENDA